MITDMNELHQHWLQVTEGGSGLHTETQLLLKVTPKGNLDNNNNTTAFLYFLFKVLSKNNGTVGHRDL